MSLAHCQELLYEGFLNTDRINGALRNHDIAEIVEFFNSLSSESVNIEYFTLCEPPVNEEFGRRVSDAIVYNSHIKRICFNNHDAAVRDLVAWIANQDTLVHMTSLVSVEVFIRHDMSVLDFDALFPLLLTSTSLHSFVINFHERTNGSIDDVISALSSYLGAASLRELYFSSHSLSEAAFTSLCDGVASSTLRKFNLNRDHFEELYLETGAESLAWMIVESSLEEIGIRGRFKRATVESSLAEGRILREHFISALKRTAPVRNLDFAFTQIENEYETLLRINRKWKPFVSENTPLALWPHILKKSHASPETSHGSAGILFYLLREKPYLVPAP